MSKLITDAITIVIVSYIINISQAKLLAKKHNYALYPNQVTLCVWYAWRLHVVYFTCGNSMKFTVLYFVGVPCLWADEFCWIIVWWFCHSRCSVTIHLTGDYWRIHSGQLVNILELAWITISICTVMLLLSLLVGWFGVFIDSFHRYLVLGDIVWATTWSEDDLC